MTLKGVQQQLRQLGELIREMETILYDGNEDTPLAFFEACEEAQHQVMQLMRAPLSLYRVNVSHVFRQEMGPLLRIE